MAEEVMGRQNDCSWGFKLDLGVWNLRDLFGSFGFEASSIVLVGKPGVISI